MRKSDIPQSARVSFKIRRSEVAPKDDPLLDWEGVVDLSPAPGFVTVTFEKADGMPAHKTFAVSDLLVLSNKEG